MNQFCIVRIQYVNTIKTATISSTVLQIELYINILLQLAEHSPKSITTKNIYLI